MRWLTQEHRVRILKTLAELRTLDGDDMAIVAGGAYILLCINLKVLAESISSVLLGLFAAAARQL